MTFPKTFNFNENEHCFFCQRYKDNFYNQTSEGTTNNQDKFLEVVLLKKNHSNFQKKANETLELHTNERNLQDIFFSHMN